MERGTIVSLWAQDEGGGRKTLCHFLAQSWCEKGNDVVIVQMAQKASVQDPAVWVPQFEGLSPSMVRNFLAAPTPSLGRLFLPQFPSEQLGKRMWALVAKAYRWVLVVGPMLHDPLSLSLVDASDVLLWVGRDNDQQAALFKDYLDQLTQLHCPLSYTHAIVNRSKASPTMMEKPIVLSHGKPVLARVPEDPAFGYSFLEAIRRLAVQLEGQPELSKPRGQSILDEETSNVLVEKIRQRVQPQLLKALEDRSQLEPTATRQTLENCLVSDSSLPHSRQERSDLLTRVMDDVMGLGPLEPLLRDSNVSEVMVNGPRCIYIEKKGKLYPSDVQFSSEEQLRTVIDRIVSPIGRRVDESSPLCDARLADGSRVNIVLPPLALDGSSITIRKFSAKSIGFKDLVAFGSLTPAMSDFLIKAVARHCNIIVSGGTGSGKTTLLNALSSAIPDDERIVTIEDAAELRLQKPHVVRLESRPSNAEGQGSIPIRRLVINALRMRPDRIVVGECRGGEALDMLQAMNTGHDGSMTTVHANSPRDALGRIETLVLMSGMDLPVRVVREQIRSAVHVIVQQARLVDGSRKVISITEVTGMEGEMLTTQELFRYRENHFEATGLAPRSLALC